ncbi:ShlB/FhaC/HecB family hemolysin secretion/activation protein [Bradyrhizobium sp. HKCCYLS2038]|uniref:ShlB/FhaC/HecB family hemolysin secretion/activation protein n=1 Tax=unclassified Bradyrhizobium TaxID=2631580 RepID=UPI003EC05B10
MWSRWRDAVICVGAGLAALTAASSDAPAQAIAPSQVTPPSLRPAQPPAGAVIVSPRTSPLTAPPGARDLTVLIGNVVVEGSFPELAGASETFTAQLTGKRVSVEAIYAAAARLEQAYVQAGFSLVRVVLPAQHLVDRGPLRVAVIDGFIEQVDVSALPAQVRGVIERRTAALVGRRHVTQAQIEHALLIAAEVPGMKLKSSLARGVAEGGTRLILEGEHHLVSVAAGTDNRLSKSLGIWQLRGSVTVNSALGWGEQVYASAGSGANPNDFVGGRPPLLLYGVGAVLPFGSDGLTVNPEYTRSITRTAAAANVPATLGTFERYSLRLRDPIRLTRTGSLYANAALELIDQQSQASEFGVALNHDHYGALRLGSEYATVLPWGAGLQLGAQGSFGLGGRGTLDADATGIPLSRQSASPQFVKWSANARLSQPLPGGLQLDVLTAGQYSHGRALLRPEQIALDGSDALTAFASGTFTADQGVTLRGELSRAFALPFNTSTMNLSPYLFGAYGHGWIVNATAVEQPSFNAESVGAGVRSGLGGAAGWTAANLTLEVARGFTDLAGVKAGWRGTMLLNVAF